MYACLFVLVCLSAGGGEDPFLEAEWLRDPVFEGVALVDLLHKEKESVPKLFGPRNVHTLFRKEVTLKAKPKEAFLRITGDDYYKFYVNGVFVVQGPETGYPFAHPYYWLDVTEFLEEGTNCLGAHGYYQGLRNRVWNSADNRSGFIMCLDVTYQDGATETILTDATWKQRRIEAFPTGESTGYQTQFIEDIDQRLVPTGWNETGYDDTGWAPPLIDRQDHVFVRQATPPLEHRRVEPRVAKDLGRGRYFYDFGREIVGHTRIAIRGKAGRSITVRHGEELRAPDRVRYDLRASTTYEEKPILTGGDDVIAFYDYRAFRYLEILNAPTEPTVWVDVRHHPFDASKSALSSSDPLLEDIWRICRHGVRVGSQGGFLDCPTREKGAYLGDAVITSRSLLWLTGDGSLTQKTLLDFAASQRICPGIMAVAPGSFMQEIAEYSLQYPLVLWEYYRHTGDTALVAQLAASVLPPLFDYFARYENAHGLLEGVDEKWVLVDWPKNLRDDYDYDYAEKRENAVLNAFYYGSLRTTAKLMEACGADAAPYTKKAEAVSKAFAARMVDPERGLYRDAPGSEHCSLHANAVPLAFGLTAGADPEKMLGLIREKGLNCGVYIASYVIEACFRNGAGDLGYGLITSKDEHSWHEMLKHGATSCMEAWGPDQKWNTSWCHPWSSSPIYLVAEYVMGLSPAEPGWGRVRIAPVAVAGLPEIRLTVPHPRGPIVAEHRPGKGYRVILPDGVPFELEQPQDVHVSVVHRGDTQDMRIDDATWRGLEKAGWGSRVSGRGVWVSVARQMLYIVEGKEVLWQAPCATAEAGTGFVEGSHQTPMGWHRVAKKFGDDAPWGQVFRSRRPTAELWKAGEETEEDLVLTRVLWLEGLEPGKNQGVDSQGRNVDSKSRLIYMHGTNGEERIGTPSSHGCVRLRNDDVIEAYRLIRPGTQVLITE